MKKRITALFMAVVLCTGTMNLPVSATEASVPEEQNVTEEPTETEEPSVEEKIVVSDESTVTGDAQDLSGEAGENDVEELAEEDGKKEESAAQLTASVTEEKEDDSANVLAASEGNETDQTPAKDEESGIVPAGG